jgi:integrase
MTRKKSMPDVTKDPFFIELCQNRELKDGTIKLYEISLQKYSEFVGKTLTELIEEAEDEEDENIRYRRRKINKYLSSFKSQLDGQDLTSSYKTLVMSKVKAFYNEYDIQLPRKKFRKKSLVSNHQTNINDLPTIDDIKRFMDYCNETYKLYVSLAISSGMGASELCSLTFGHLYKALQIELHPNTMPELIQILKGKKNEIPMWNLTRIKTGNDYFTFSSPESISFMIKYLDKLYRKFGDTYTPKAEDTLLRSTMYKDRGIKPYNVFAIFELINKSNNLPKNGKKYQITSHVFRKFFATTLERNKIPHLTTRWLMGHTIDSTTSAYFRADPESLKEDYLDVVNELSVDNTKVVKANNLEELLNALREQGIKVKPREKIGDDFKES